VYELWVTQGQGGSKEREFASLQEALDHVKEHVGEASFAIMLPNGSWYQWPDEG
jgi:hypothetical protein